MDPTRSWFFDDFLAWNRDHEASHDQQLVNKRKLFWLSGTGGTGKSVVSAVVVMKALRKDSDDEKKRALADLGCKLVGWYVFFYFFFPFK